MCFPEEACALLVGTRDVDKDHKVSRVVFADNIADNKNKFFEVDPSSRISLERELRNNKDEIIGVFHSHPDGKAMPSASDERMIVEKHFIWVIAAIDQLQNFEIGAFEAQQAWGFRSIPLIVTKGN
ncbi:hypothetical protein A9Q83_03710 [Alphaproteobacteria bacterium 46_93_T64]|nr:hypothetical protein A9Q83_03710 [Alphaproteobacteria bacterium 46_93_T64]